MKYQDQNKNIVGTELFEEVANLCCWLDRHALPLWFTKGFDHNLGIFHERLNIDGQPITEVPRRLLVQCRQIAVYASATLRGRIDASVKLRAVYERVRALYLIKENPGYWRYSIESDGAPLDERIDSYTLVFVIFALAWLYRLDPRQEYLEEIDAIFFLLDGPLSARGGGIAVKLPQEDDHVSQNPNMHLFEACITLYEAAGRKKDFNRAKELVRLFTVKLFDYKSRALPEQHLSGWKISDASNNWFEPGHHFEWSWLFRQFERLGGDNCSVVINQLAERALSEGIDKNGNVIEQVGMLAGYKKKTSRNWGICEYIKFCAAEYQEKLWEQDADTINLWISRAQSGLKVLYQTFLSTPTNGCWHDRVDETGEPVTNYALASSFYHISFAISEAERIFTRVVPNKIFYHENPRKAIFLDRDGIINVDVMYAYQVEQIIFTKGIFEFIERANKLNYIVIVISNQSGVSRGYYEENDVINIHKWMARLFEKRNLEVHAFYHCPYSEFSFSKKYFRENHYDRKPNSGMIKRAILDWNIDLEGSIMIGDKQSDIDAARSIGLKSFLVRDTNELKLIQI